MRTERLTGCAAWILIAGASTWISFAGASWLIAVETWLDRALWLLVFVAIEPVAIALVMYPIILGTLWIAAQLGFLRAE